MSPIWPVSVAIMLLVACGVIVLAWHILSGRALVVSLGRLLLVLYAPALLVCESLKHAMQNSGLSHREEHRPFSSSWSLYCDELHGRIEIRTWGFGVTWVLDVAAPR